MSKRVCVVGAGIAGLSAIKSCLEANLDVVCYEATDGIGGLWNYNRTSNEGTKTNLATVMESTIVNTSKEMCAFSDFPPSAELPNYMHNTSFCNYLKMYAEHFQLTKHIQLNTTVAKIEKALDYEQSGKWTIRLSNGKMETFDDVMICSGHFEEPYTPHFDGFETFKGSVSHSQAYKNWKGYENKRVLLIGIGNSSVDIACELSHVAKQVYISTRRGAWILSRLGTKGIPSDAEHVNRFEDFLFSKLPTNFLNNIVEKAANLRMDHELYGLKPKHRFSEQHIIVGDSLPICLASGSVIVKGDVKRFCQHSVVFEDDSEHEIDCVIFCTGYIFGFPFLDDDVVPMENNEVSLYKFVFPPRLPHPTLAIIGLVVPLGAIGPVTEMQSRWAAQIFLNNVQLPSIQVMEEDIRIGKEKNEKNFYKSLRHTLKIPFISYLDEMADDIGAKPNLVKLFFTDHKLFRACFFGPCAAYMYRLNGKNSWSGARQAILDTMDRINRPLQNRAVARSEKSGQFPWAFVLFSILFAFLLFNFTM